MSKKEKQTTSAYFFTLSLYNVILGDHPQLCYFISMKMEFNIITRKHWCKSLAENYPDLTEEAFMPPRKLLEMGYDYEELIDRRDIPYLRCLLQSEGDHYIVLTKYKDGYEKLGTIPKDKDIQYCIELGCMYRVRVDGGQKIKVVEGNYRDKKVEVYVPYTFVLVFRLNYQWW